MYLKKIKKHLEFKININFIKIDDDSKLHNYAKNTNIISHLKIIIVSDDFINKNLIIRHRIIFKALKEIEKESIYSITLYTYTINEWKDKKFKKINSIKCIKKNKNFI